ncbi:MAG: peptidoglycan DD-metalloendopeptidase family protein [Alphaproteobacteria bacterium]|nr:peptidoglycan DD-metalloendopeptidase family protein [Alphaproteobacteria bacterium]
MIAVLAALAADGLPEAALRYTSPATPFLHRPFQGDFPNSGVFDHRAPPPVNDHRQLTAWGVRTWGKAGHAGYDFPMREGTAVLAAAEGVVEEAGDVGPTNCGGRPVEHDIRVRLRHEVDGRAIHTAYLHLSSVVVKAGDRVAAGQVVAHSGNTGCSSGPHLHFGVFELNERGRPVAIDPYGWDADTPDPTLRLPLRHAEWMWLDGEAPLLFRPSGRSTADARGDVRITGFRGMGWQDGRYPNNEFVMVGVRTAGPRRVDLSGWRIRNRAGLVYTFPEGARVHRGEGLRVYSGTGVDGPDTLFWGRAAGVWNDEGDCVELIDARGDVVQVHHQGRREDDWCGTGAPSDGEPGPRPPRDGGW